MNNSVVKAGEAASGLLVRYKIISILPFPHITTNPVCGFVVICGVICGNGKLNISFSLMGSKGKERQRKGRTCRVVCRRKKTVFQNQI